jgi:hypothetical protein
MTITKSIGLIFLVLMMITISVSAGGYEPILPDPTDGSGAVEITVLCHQNIFSNKMILTNNIAPGESKEIYLDHAGTFNDRFVPGDYTVKLLDGNGGQPETQKFRIDAGYLTRVSFIGHAVSNVGTQEEPENPCKDLVITAGNIHRVFFLSWFEIGVTNPNDNGGWAWSHVTITDSMGHTVFDTSIYAPDNDSYSFFFPAANSHRTHNPLSVSVSGTVCRPYPDRVEQ